MSVFEVIAYSTTWQTRGEGGAVGGGEIPIFEFIVHIVNNYGRGGGCTHTFRGYRAINFGRDVRGVEREGREVCVYGGGRG